MNSHAPDIKGVHIGIGWKTGIAAKDWDSVARKEKIEVRSQSQLPHRDRVGRRIANSYCILPLIFNLVLFYYTFPLQDFEPMLMKLEASVQTIHEKLIYLKKREEEMREVSERTNAAVELFSIMSLSICILVASLQIWYLKRFFRKKKLI
ncbi:hypothetical protein BC332_15809 [Capsicum chinense]|nr:hypothetical protein BC332_15809 [Capsicum chinense]